MKARGFTLIELLVVVAMISVIVGIASNYFADRNITDDDGTVVERHTTEPAKCVNGIVHRNSEPVVKDGYAVRC